MRSVYAALFVMFPMMAQADCVVLLHGLARGQGSWSVMVPALQRAGYSVENAGYPSTDAPIAELLPHVDNAMAACAGRGATHVVTHSMGGILFRAWVAARGQPFDGRVVMLGPPNGGSELVDKLGDFAPFRWVNGPAGLQLGTDADSVPNQLGPYRGALGVIAGSRSVSPVFSALIPGRDDGKVAVEATKIDGMIAHLTVPSTHTFMMMNPVVVGQVLHFLEHERFQPGLTAQDTYKRLSK